MKKIFNLHLVISEQGKIAATYRKVHLFDAPVTGLQESKTTAPGDELIIVDMGFARVGLAVCYDLRFPAMFGAMRSVNATANDATYSMDGSVDNSAEIFLIPAAFTVKTGKAHWDILLRARAIENQCYVVAAAQIGRHNEHRESYGRSLIIDCWGEVIAAAEAHDPDVNIVSSATTVSLSSFSVDCPGSTNITSDILKGKELGGRICVAPFNRSYLRSVRRGMPVLVSYLRFTFFLV